MTDERINNIKTLFDEYELIIKAAILRENKVCSRDIMELMKVRVYNAERTVCDFLKYSSRVGNDVALEVIKNYVHRKNKNLQLLFEYATKLRVKKYIKPYVEVLL